MIVAFDRMNFREPSSLSVERLWQELLDLFCFHSSIANLVTWIEPVDALTTAPEAADTATFVGHDITDEAEQSAAAAVRMQAIQRGRMSRAERAEQSAAAEKMQAIQRGRMSRAERAEQSATAEKMQAIQRGRMSRAEQAEQSAAAEKMQAIQRGRISRAERAEQSAAAEKMQAIQRGRMSRATVDTSPADNDDGDSTRAHGKGDKSDVKVNTPHSTVPTAADRRRRSMAFEKERLAKQQVEQTARVDGRRRRQSFDARQHAKERQRAKQVLDKNLCEDNLQLGGGSFNLHPDETVTTDGDSELFPELRRLCAQSHGKLLSAEDRALQSKLIAIKWNNGQGQLTEAEEDLMRENIVVRIQSQWRIKKAARLVRKLRKEDRALRAMSRRIREERKELLEPSTVDQQRRISREQSHRHVEEIRRK